MSYHIMKNPEDLDIFSPEQIELTRILDLDAGSSQKFICDMIEALSAFHCQMALAGIARFQRATYEAGQRMLRNASKPDMLAMTALWRAVKYMQEVRNEAERSLKDPDVRRTLGSAGEKMGIDLLGEIDRKLEE